MYFAFTLKKESRAVKYRAKFGGYALIQSDELLRVYTVTGGHSSR
jgi:hypothetical protein